MNRSRNHEFGLHGACHAPRHEATRAVRARCIRSAALFKLVRVRAADDNDANTALTRRKFPMSTRVHEENALDMGRASPAWRRVAAETPSSTWLVAAQTQSLISRLASYLWQTPCTWTHFDTEVNVIGEGTWAARLIMGVGFSADVAWDVFLPVPRVRIPCFTLFPRSGSTIGHLLGNLVSSAILSCFGFRRFHYRGLNLAWKLPCAPSIGWAAGGRVTSAIGSFNVGCGRGWRVEGGRERKVSRCRRIVPPARPLLPQKADSGFKS